MDQTARFSSLGKQFMRTFIAFIVSYYVVFVQIWLGIELFKLAKELERMGQEYGIIEFRKSAKQFMGVRAAAFAAFVLGVVTTVFSFWQFDYYGGVLGYGPGYYLGSILYQLSVILPFLRMIPTIIGIGMSIGAWNQIHKYFAQTDPTTTRFGARGLRSSARVRWALAILIPATVLQLITRSNLYSYFDHYYNYYYPILSIVSIVGAILMLLGSANAGVGWYDTSKVFMNFNAIHEKRPMPEELLKRATQSRPPRNAYMELPFHPNNLAHKTASTEQYEDTPIAKDYSEIPIKQEKMKYCYNCGTLLPEVSGLRFCPNCGIRVN